MKWAVFCTFAIGCVPLLAVMAACWPRFRDGLVGALIASTAVAVNVNFISREWYRGADRGFEVTLTDLLAVALAIGLLVARRGRVRWIPFNTWPMAFYFLIACVSVSQSPMPIYSWFTVAKLAKAYLLYWTIYNAFAARFSLSVLWWSAVTVAGLETALAVWQKYGLGLFRIHGTLFHSNLVTPYCLLLLPVLLAWVLHGEGLGRGRTLATLAAVLGLCFTVVATMSRAGVLLLAFCVIVLLTAALVRRCSLRQVGIAGLFAILFVVGAVRAADTLAYRFRSAPESSAIARQEFNEAARLMLGDNAFGVGVNAYSYVLTNTPDYREHISVMQVELQAGVCHHIYWLTAAEMGYMGLVALLVVIVRFVARPLTGLVGPPRLERALALGLVLGAVSLHTFGMVEWVFRSTPVLNLFLITSAIAALLAEDLAADRRTLTSLLYCRRHPRSAGLPSGPSLGPTLAPVRRFPVKRIERAGCRRMNSSEASNTNDRHGTLMANVATSYLRFFITAATMFVLTPFVIARVGTEDYGLWMLAICLVGYFELLECGLLTATVRYVAEFNGRGDVERRNRLASTLLAVYVVLAACAAGLAAVAAVFLADWFSIPDLEVPKATAVVLILSARLVIGLPLSLFHGVLFAGERICLVNTIKIASTLMSAAGVWLVLSAGYGIIGQASVVAVAVAAESLVYLAVTRRALPDLVISLRDFDVGLLRAVAPFAGCALMTNLAAVILFRTDPLIVSLHLPLAAVAVYGLALKISEQVGLFTKQIVSVVTPRLAALYGAGRRSRIDALFLDVSRFALASAALVALPLAVVATDATRLWVGEPFAASGPILVILLAAVGLRVLQEAGTGVLGMTGGHAFVARASLIGAFVNIALSLILVIPLGPTGVALATLVTTALVGLGMVNLRACSEYEVTAARYWQRVVAPVLRPVGVQLVACLTLRTYLPPQTLAAVLLQTAAGAAIFAVAFWHWGLEPAHRAALRTWLASALGGPTRRALKTDLAGHGDPRSNRNST